jgi:serine/threonine protein kinase
MGGSAMAAFVRNGRIGLGDGGGARLVPGMAVRAGQVIAGKYRVEELLGAGAAGIVVAAKHIHLRERVTLKILAAYTDQQEELLAKRVAKARLAARLSGEHAAKILDIGTTEDGQPFVATEHLEGTTLDAEVAQRGGRVPVDVAVRWALQACEGLAEAHALGLVHGDLKPHNLFLTSKREPGPRRIEGQDGGVEGERVLKILDFGMANSIEALGDASASAWFGSPAYLAPEQIREPERVDTRADHWALGVILYELIAGQLPFGAETVSGVLVAVCFDTPPLLTDAPYELARVIARCMEREPEGRFDDVADLARALAPFAGERGDELAERVAVALSTPPADPVRDASASGSVPAFAIDLDDPRDASSSAPLFKRRGYRAGGAWDQQTRPSQRVRARRSRATALAVMAGGAAVIAAAWLGTRPTTLEAAHLPATVVESREPLVAVTLGRSVAVSTESEDTEDTEDETDGDALAEGGDAADESDAEASATDGEAAKTKAAAKKKKAKHSRSRWQPTKKTATSTATKADAPSSVAPASRLPAGLPSTREPVSSSRASSSSTASSSDLRNLFNERK